MTANKMRGGILWLYVFSVLMVLVGLGVIAGGILGGIMLRNRIQTLGRELAVLKVHNIDDWGDIPGTRERSLNHQFHVFNISNPREVLYGQRPISQMYGPWTFNEERNTETVDVSKATDIFNETGELFSFDDYVKFYHTRTSGKMASDLSDSFYVYNPETFIMQYSHRVEDDWLRAIRSLSGMINYTSVQFRDNLILEHMRINYYQDNYANQEVFTDNRLIAFNGNSQISQEAIQGMWTDQIFGFSNFRNAKFWGDICEGRLPFGRTFVKDYFFLPNDGLDKFLNLFCEDWDSSAYAVAAAFRMRGLLSPEIMFYRQWADKEAANRILGQPKSITDMDSLVAGQVDLPTFLEEVFFKNTDIRDQFEDVEFGGSSATENRLLKLFSQEDLQMSLFNATNMKTLFDLGSQINIDSSTGKYEIYKLQPLADEMNNKASAEELFIVYSFLRNLIDNTFLRSNTQSESTFDKVSVAFGLTDILRNEFIRFRANFTSRMIAQGAIKFLALDDCRTSFVRLFPLERASTFCNIPKFDVSTLEGAEFWWRLYIGRSPEDIRLLERETSSKIEDFDKYFNDDYSDFVQFTRSMMDAIGARLLDKICRKEGDLWCSIQEISFHQMVSGIITRNPPPILENLSPADNFIDFFGLDDQKLISPEFNFLGKFQGFELDPEIDVTYIDIVQGMRDSRLFNPFFILKILNDE